MGQDLKYDGDPIGDYFSSPTSGLKLWHGKWPASVKPNGEQQLKGVWILIHGLRGYSRYSWLLKEPLCNDGKAIMSMKDVVGDLSTDLPSDASLSDRDIMPFYTGSWVHAWNHLGYAVHAMDLQGHGLSEGRRCVIEDVNTLVSDVGHYIWSVVAPQYSESVPIHVIGVSLGGNVLIRCLQTPRHRRLQAAIIIGGMCTTPADGTALMPKLGALLNRYVISKVVPNLPVAPMGDAVTEANVGYLENCPHIWTKPLTSQTVDNLISIAKSLREAPIGANWCTRKLLILHNTTDPTCPIAGCIPFWNKLAESKAVPDVKFAILNKSLLRSEVESTVSDSVKSRLWDNLKTDLDLRHALMCDVDHAYVFYLIQEFSEAESQDYK